MERLKPFLALHRCWTCGTAISLKLSLCDSCHQQLQEEPLGEGYLWVHEGSVHRLVGLWRSQAIQRFAYSYIERRMQAWQNFHGICSIDTLVTIPQKKSLSLERLAQYTAGMRNLNWAKSCLKKDGLRSQHGRSFEERWSAGMFIHCVMDCRSLGHILLIDDVETSGTTLLQGKRALMKRGAKKVTTLAVAKQMVPGIERQEKNAEQKIEEEAALWFHFAV